MKKATLVVYDLEYTAWEGSWARGWSGPGEHREIIQIGAVRLSADFTELAAIDVVVRPRINPLLSPYIMALTGLSQARLDAEGVDIAEAFARLAAFAAPDLPLASNGIDSEIITENCGLARLPDPCPGRWINVEHRIAAAVGRRPHSAELPGLFGLPGDARGHDALADARAVAGTLKVLWQRGA
jgi:inhibitor of KinA sporulation pathway (predicted exonuclease)